MLRLHDNLKRSTQSVPEIIKLVFGQRGLAKPKDMTDLVLKDKSLNEFQQQAVRFTLGSPHLALIHGPPGELHKKKILVYISFK